MSERTVGFCDQDGARAAVPLLVPPDHACP